MSARVHVTNQAQVEAETGSLMFPRVLSDNLARLPGVVVSASSEAPGWPALAARSDNTFERWQPTAMPAWWSLDLGTAQPCNACAIAAHNLGTVASTTHVQSSPDNATWTARSAAMLSASKGREIWRNGVRIASNPAKIGTRQTEVTPMRLGAVDWPGDNNDVYLFGVASRAWSDDEIIRWHTNPWQIFGGTSQPLDPHAAIDWNNPLTTGLVDVFNGLSTSNPTSVRRFVPVASGQVTAVTRPEGRAVSFTAGEPRGFVVIADNANDLFPDSNTATIFVVRQSRDTIARNGELFGYSTADSLVIAHAPFGDGFMYFDYGGADPTRRIVVPFEKTTAVETLVFVAHATTPTDNPLLLLYPTNTSRHWRLHVAGAAAPTIGHIRFGRALTLEHGIAGPHVPLDYARRVVVSPSRSEGGQWLGASVRRTGQRSDVQISGLTWDWWRTHGDPFVREARDRARPFFFAWNPARAPQDVAYCTLDADVDPAHRAGDLVDVTLSLSGFAGP